MDKLTKANFQNIVRNKMNLNFAEIENKFLQYPGIKFVGPSIDMYEHYMEPPKLFIDKSGLVAEIFTPPMSHENVITIPFYGKTYLSFEYCRLAIVKDIDGETYGWEGYYTVKGTEESNKSSWENGWTVKLSNVLKAFRAGGDMRYVDSIPQLLRDKIKLQDYHRENVVAPADYIAPILKFVKDAGYV